MRFRRGAEGRARHAEFVGGLVQLEQVGHRLDGALRFVARRQVVVARRVRVHQMRLANLIDGPGRPAAIGSEAIERGALSHHFPDQRIFLNNFSRA